MPSKNVIAAISHPGSQSVAPAAVVQTNPSQGRRNTPEGRGSLHPLTVGKNCRKSGTASPKMKFSPPVTLQRNITAAKYLDCNGSPEKTEVTSMNFVETATLVAFACALAIPNSLDALSRAKIEGERAKERIKRKGSGGLRAPLFN
eukprot:687477-Rhodomonas_salina.1